MINSFLRFIIQSDNPKFWANTTHMSTLFQLLDLLQDAGANPQANCALLSTVVSRTPDRRRAYAPQMVARILKTMQFLWSRSTLASDTDMAATFLLSNYTTDLSFLLSGHNELSGHETFVSLQGLDAIREWVPIGFRQAPWELTSICGAVSSHVVFLTKSQHAAGIAQLFEFRNLVWVIWLSLYCAEEQFYPLFRLRERDPVWAAVVKFLIHMIHTNSASQGHLLGTFQYHDQDIAGPVPGNILSPLIPYGIQMQVDFHHRLARLLLHIPGLDPRLEEYTLFRCVTVGSIGSE
jgi:hypothetical protein